MPLGSSCICTEMVVTRNADRREQVLNNKRKIKTALGSTLDDSIKHNAHQECPYCARGRSECRCGREKGEEGRVDEGRS
jgi:hypothetical protein